MKKQIASLINKAKGIYTLPKVLHNDINQLEAARNNIVREIQQLQAQANGLEATILAMFKTDALTNNGMKPNQRIEFLGNFKYRIVNAPKSQEQPETPAEPEQEGEGQ